jgi:hypothetical protein
MGKQTKPTKKTKPTNGAAVAKNGASDLVRTEWMRRVEAEYTSAAVTQHVTLWLIQIGASPDLIHGGMRIADDEIVHAELSHEAYVEAGGAQALQLVRERLGLRRTETDPLEYDVTRVAVNTFCLGETVAVPLFKTLREGCTVPAARRVLDRVLKDEVRHRDFGWATLEWLLDHPMANELRALVNRELPRYFARLRMAYGAPIRHLTFMAPEDRVWGLMPPAEYASVVDRTLTRDWIPRFALLDIDARRCWDEAPIPAAASPT